MYPCWNLGGGLGLEDSIILLYNPACPGGQTTKYSVQPQWSTKWKTMENKVNGHHYKMQPCPIRIFCTCVSRRATTCSLHFVENPTSTSHPKKNKKPFGAP
jgi:hypothetical protein